PVLAMVPYAAAGPLSGSVPPIRMASLVTPTSLAVSAPATAAPAVAAAGAAVATAGTAVAATTAALVATGAGLAGAPFEHAATARLIRTTKTLRMLADLTVVDSFLVVLMYV